MKKPLVNFFIPSSLKAIIHTVKQQRLFFFFSSLIFTLTFSYQHSTLLIDKHTRIHIIASDDDRHKPLVHTCM